MKLILLQDVERLGSRGQVVTVKDGYARNYLLPKKIALKATPAQLKQLDNIRNQLATKEEKIRKRLAGFAEKLGLVSLKTTIRTGNEGAFGAITNADIAGLLAQAGFEIDRHSIVLSETVRGPGIYDIPIKLGHEVTATVKLWVAEEPA
ncbi:50S ribosomal protein L9 [candidate division WOR-3 bacterium JGI_Cruoil_03_51_56]|uniref:Large ribosomal subunit protein bL9 n=1 Tax=candidate division WOR-3 bacterium JGI_Cruoil_03_51_56 TaxID=1973747 RepID=A0A235BUP4_UNCW3|nr:MAG: 50S ribosomal protein L9 [candidate division WOR-3 bacterium JGI_Cruoil_03_51_56]